MDKAMLTILNIAILAEWPEIVRPIFIKQPLLVVVFLAFMWFISFGLMNVIIGLIVDSVMDRVAKMKEDAAEIEHIVKLDSINTIEALLFQLYCENC